MYLVPLLKRLEPDLLPINKFKNECYYNNLRSMLVMNLNILLNGVIDIVCTL